MKKILFLISAASFLAVNSVKGQSLGLHPWELATQTSNIAYKSLRNKWYKDKVEQIKEIKEEVVRLKLTIEEANRLFYNGMTTVNDAILEAKKLKYISESLIRTSNNLEIATRLALGIKGKLIGYDNEYIREMGGGLVITVTTPIYENPILPLHYKYQKLIYTRCFALGVFIRDYILDKKKQWDPPIGYAAEGSPTNTGTGLYTPGVGGGTNFGSGGVDNGNASGLNGGAVDYVETDKNNLPNMISNVVRERFLTNVYSKVYTIELITKSYVYAIKTVKWQEDIESIVPWRLYFNRDKQMVDNILNRIRL